MCYDINVGTGCTVGRAPHTKETLPDFRELGRVTRHSRVFCGLTSSQRTPGFWGFTKLNYMLIQFFLINEQIRFLDLISI